MTNTHPTVADIINAIPVLNELASTRMSIQQALHVQQDLDALNQVLEAFHSQRQALADSDEAEERMRELLEEPLTGITMLSTMSDLMTAGVRVQPNQVQSLVRLFGTISENGGVEAEQS